MKPFKTFDEQLEILKKHKLDIKSPETTRYYLKLYGYYPLVNGYKDAFLLKQQEEKIYRPGTSFDEIVNLYSFDYKLRNILLESLFIIEKSLKSIISYEFSKSYGESHVEYLTPKCFNTATPVNAKRVLGLLNKMESTIEDFEKKNNNVINHYLTVHKTIPLWVLFTVSTFGQLSIFYANLKDPEMKKIANEFSLNPTTLKSMLYFLSIIRNICAHGDRLYSYKKDRKRGGNIPILSIHEKLQIPKLNDSYSCGTNDILAVLICFKYLLPPSLLSSTITELQRTMSNLKAKINPASLDYVFQVSGLHDEYLKRL